MRFGSFSRLFILAVFCTIASGTRPSVAASDIEGLTCLRAPFETAGTEEEQELRSLVVWLASALDHQGGLAAMLEETTLEICLADQLFGMQGYFEVETDRIVLNGDLEPGLMRAVAIHELRHAQQSRMGVCLDPDLSMKSSARLVLAMEADASAITAGIGWLLRQSGNAEVWNGLAGWPGQSNVVRAFEIEMENSKDFASATAMAFRAWYESDNMIDVYYRAACGAYLDRLDETHAIPRYGTLDAATFQALCRLPTGEAYTCIDPELATGNGQ